MRPRQATGEIAAITATLASLGLKLHGFGVHSPIGQLSGCGLGKPKYLVANGDTYSPTLPAGTTSYLWHLGAISQGKWMCLAAIAINSVGSTSDWTPYNCGIMPMPTFVAMGDSYSAGQGAPPYTDDGCRTSTNTYSMQYSIQSNTPFGVPNLVACYGAQTSDITTPNSHGNPSQPAQTDWLSSSTRLITLTIGGNDVNFAGILQDCAILQQPNQPLPCDAELDNVEKNAIPNEQGTLKAVYQAIRQHAANAKIVVLTYPKIFPALSCHTSADPLSGTAMLTPDQLARINADWVQFNTVIKNAAADANVGITVVDVGALFALHDVCSATPYANAFLANDAHASYHPTAAGYAAEATALYQMIGNGT